MSVKERAAALGHTPLDKDATTERTAPSGGSGVTRQDWPDLTREDKSLQFAPYVENGYLPLPRRLQWFREVYPQGCLTTEDIEGSTGAGFVSIKAGVYVGPEKYYG